MPDQGGAQSTEHQEICGVFAQIRSNITGQLSYLRPFGIVPLEVFLWMFPIAMGIIPLDRPLGSLPRKILLLSPPKIFAPLSPPLRSCHFWATSPASLASSASLTDTDVDDAGDAGDVAQDAGESNTPMLLHNVQHIFRFFFFWGGAGGEKSNCCSACFGDSVAPCPLQFH